MRKINEIIVHCSYTKPSMDIDADWIRRLHTRQNGWLDIGYHFVVKRCGSVEVGRPVEQPGAHCRGHNANSIGICMVGGMSDENRPEDNFLPEQFIQLRQSIYVLKQLYPGITKVTGHLDYDKNKACPCFDVHQKLEI